MASFFILRPFGPSRDRDAPRRLLPRMLRQLSPDSKLGFFLHVPFPSSELYRTLPFREEILRGLLAADLLGFQTYDYARHFLSLSLIHI